MIELRIEAQTATELHTLILGLAGLSAAPAHEVAAPAEKPKAAPRKAREVAPEAANDDPQSATSAPGESPTPDAASSASDTSPTSETEIRDVVYADVQKAVTALAAARGRDAAVEVLGTFGVGHGKDLKPEQWGEAVAALTEALAA